MAWIEELWADSCEHMEE